MTKGLSIIVAAYDRPDQLRETLNSLFQLRVPADTDAEILVVLSARMKDTVAVVHEAQQRSPIPMRLVPERQAGLSHARNQGMDEASYDYVAYFDDDVRVSPDWIAGFFEAVDRHGADCVVGPVSPLYCDKIPDYVSEEVLDSILSSYSRRGDEVQVLEARVGHEIPGCNFGLRVQAARDVGGFSPDFGRAGPVIIGGDDFEFGLRLVAAGKRVVYQPRCAIEHAITAEKFSKSWLRRRWYGNGIFERRAADDPAFMRSSWAPVRAAVSIGRRFLWAALLGLAGRPAVAFEQELRARRALGYSLGRNPLSRRPTAPALPGRLVRRYRATVLRLAETTGLDRHPTGAPEEHARAAVDWILQAQEAGADGGVPALYNILSRAWTPSYPETTGYIICSMLRAANSRLGDPVRLRESAGRMGKWLLSTQMETGAFPAGYIDLPDPQPAFFNTGQILKGLTDLIQAGQDPDGTFARSAAAAARWMMEQQDADGAWRRGASPLTTEPLHTYYVRAAWPLARYGKACGVPEAVKAGVRHAEWVLSLQDQDDWFPHMNFSVGQFPYTHTIAYTIQGLLEIGVLCDRREFREGAERAARRMLALQDTGTGALCGQIKPAYQPAAKWTSTTGNAQMAIIGFRLAEITGDGNWRAAAERLNRFNSSIQSLNHRDPDRRGGLLSAWPGRMGYTPYQCTNWTQKFHLDALMAEMGTSIV